MASSYYQAIVVCLFVGGGTMVSIVMKICFDTSAPGRDGNEKKFQKPWCAMFLMNLAMMSTLLKYWYDRRKGARAMADSGVSTTTVALKISIPAFLCLSGTFLQAAGLMFVPVSIYQMLISSIIIFSAIVRFFWMGKGLARYEACGIVLTAIGLTLVGSASIVSGENSTSETPVGMLILGIILVLAAQAVLALEAVIEENLLHGYSAPPEFVCGMVGTWGLLYTSAIFLPIAQFLPGDEGNGLREDSIETMLMIMNNSTIRLLLLIFFVSILLYNITMRLLITITQATTMQVLGGLRTLCVWIVALLMYFEWPQYGEKWASSTWIELAGFLILMFGVFLYRATFKLPCFEYPKPMADASVSLQQDTE